MRRSLSTRLLAMLLAVTLLISMCPTAFAAEDEITDPSEVIDIVEETEAPAEETEAPVQTEESEQVPPPAEETEAPEADQTPEETENTESSEETEAPVEETEAPAEEETEAPAEETEAPAEEETEAPAEEELSLFQGLPEGYALAKRHDAKRTAMEKHDTLDSIAGLTAGRNYVSDRIIVGAENAEEAELFAQAFSGALLEYSHGLALIQLDEATALEAIQASMDPENNLPVASPNYTYSVTPIQTKQLSVFSDVPSQMDWNAWVHDTLENPDPALLFPSTAEYQYQHDVVESYAGWGVTTGWNQVKVGVIDSGVDFDHPDLHVNTYDVGMGAEDTNGHGTHVTGIIAAYLGNGEGGAGIAPNVQVTSYCVGNANGSIDGWAMLQAIYAAADNGEWIINMSLGGFFYDYEDDMAIQYANAKGTTVVVAMGNDGTNAKNYPAGYDNVIAVGATDMTDGRAYFSNFGEWCDVSAPGWDILSTYPMYDPNSGEYTGGYAWMSGTSMACPVVTGVCALYMSWKGHVSPAQMEKALEAGCTPCPDKGMGAGVVNLANMMDEKPGAPIFWIEEMDDAGNWIQTLYFSEDYKGQAVPCESYLNLGYYGLDQNFFLLYTINGKTPSVKDGEIVNGQVCDSLISLAPYAGQTITLKVMQVSGMGIAGKVLTQKIKVAESIKVTGVTLTGPTYLVAGKSAQFEAVVEPADKANQDVRWEIDPSFKPSGVKISTSGKLTTAKTSQGVCRIWAISEADNNYKSYIDITIAPYTPVSKIVLNPTAKTVWVGEIFTINAKALNAAGGSIEVAELKWTSSNTKVAVVDDLGNVTAVGKGTATITCTAMDGSNKKATCKITVKQQVQEVSITGYTTIIPGGSVTLKAELLPADASTKGVTWTLEEAPSGVKLSSSGKLTVAKSVPVGSVITLCAQSKDGYGAFVYHSLLVTEKADKIVLDAYYEGLAQGVLYKSNGLVNSLNLFSVDLNETEGVDNAAQLLVVLEGPANGNLEYTSSKPSVASVNEYGEIVGHKAGTATITAKLLDGSNKKATLTVKVTNPVSNMDIDTSGLQMTNGNPYVAFGKSITNKVVFNDTYGKPSNTKVDWLVSVYAVTLDDEGYLDVVEDLTEEVMSKKLVTVSSSGKVSTKKGLINYWASYPAGVELFLEIVAVPTDGTEQLGIYAIENYLMIPATGYMSPIVGYKNINFGVDYGVGMGLFSSDQWVYFGQAGMCAFSATSSNPDVASVGYLGIYYTVDSNGDMWVYTDQYDNLIYEIDVVANKTGSAKVTVVANDGSGKKVTFNVKVGKGNYTNASFEDYIQEQMAAGKIKKVPADQLIK